MSSERTPERCVHAPDGPDWAGLREPSSWKERALAAEAKLVGMTVEDQWVPITGHEQRLVGPWLVVEGDDQ